MDVSYDDCLSRSVKVIIYSVFSIALAGVLYLIIDAYRGSDSELYYHNVTDNLIYSGLEKIIK